jgi:hypothetical protein
LEVVLGRRDVGSVVFYQRWRGGGRTLGIASTWLLFPIQVNGVGARIRKVGNVVYRSLVLARTFVAVRVGLVFLKHNSVVNSG